MASNTKNVRLGVCKVWFGGVDLGYTKGGVDVTVKTDTHKVNVDQFGKTPINEYIMGREVLVKVPLAETTLENMVGIMPGATLVSNGVKAFATVTATAIIANDTVSVDGVTFTFKAAPATALEVLLGGSLAASLTNLAAAITAYAGLPATATATATTITITADVRGITGNLITLAKLCVGIAAIAATLTGGVDATAEVVNVPTAIGTSLLDVAKKLVLHPIDKLDSDASEDFTVFLAATAGALQFAYKLDAERVFQCEFNGYPDPVSGKLFAVGNTSAV